MRVTIAAAALALSIISPSAYAKTSAASLLHACNEQLLSKKTTGAAFCIFYVGGFLDGLAQGVNRGVRYAYTADNQNMATTRGVDDFRDRATKVVKIAECIPVDVDAQAVIPIYVRHIERHSEKKNKAAAEVLEDALHENFRCP